MVQSKKTIIFEVLGIFVLSLLFSQGLGNVLVGDLNLLDEGQFAAWAFEMVHRKFLFKDTFVMYGPLFIYPLYILYKVFGVSFFLLRIYFWFCSLGGIFALYVLTIQLQFKRFIRLAIMLFTILLPIMQSRQSVALWSFVVLFLIQQKVTMKRILLLGALHVCSFLVSPEIGIFLTPAIIVWIFFERKQITKKYLTGYFFSLVVTSVVFFLWSSWEGWFTSYLGDTVAVLQAFSGINAPLGKNYISPVSILSAHSLKEFIKLSLSKELILSWTVLFYIAISLYFSIRIVLRRLNTTDKKLIPIFVMGILLYTTIVGRSDVGHYYFMLPFIFLLGGYFFEILIKQIQNESHKYGRWLYIFFA